MPRACAVLATCLRQRMDSEGALPLPPPSPAPTQERGEDSEEVARGHGGGGRGQTDMPGGETGGERWRRKYKKKEQSKPTRQGKKARRQGPKLRRPGRGRGDTGPQGTLVKNPTSGVWGPQRGTPPPHCSLALCLCHACVVPRHACYKGKTTRATRGMTVAERGPPPRRTTRQGGEAAERGCRTDHTTVSKGSTRRASPNGGPPGVRLQGR